ncbi:MAG: acyl-CoA reductase [Bacteroidota bacterium]
MNLQARINALVRLGEKLQEKNDYLEAVMHRTKYNNPWFTIENQQRAIKGIATGFLNKEKLENWINNYELVNTEKIKNIGLIMAGNIPLANFHDFLCVFVSGHKSLIKLSEQDKYLLPYLLKLLIEIDSRSENYFEIINILKNYDAVVATGNTKSVRYLETYFGKVPNIIRKNKNAVAVLSGGESADNLFALGKDIFRYYGLGSRNVSKLYLPENYDFQLLLEKLHEYKEIVLNHKYKNNFDYNMALLMMNKTPFWNNGCIILSENKSIASRIAHVHFEYYTNKLQLTGRLIEDREKIECVVSNLNIDHFKRIAFGKTQEPGLSDFADGVDTLKFLSSSISES